MKKRIARAQLVPIGAAAVQILGPDNKRVAILVGVVPGAVTTFGFGPTLVTNGVGIAVTTIGFMPELTYENYGNLVCQAMSAITDGLAGTILVVEVVEE